MKMERNQKHKFSGIGEAVRSDGEYSSFSLSRSQVARGKSPSILRLGFFLYDFSTLGTFLLVWDFLTSKEKPNE